MPISRLGAGALVAATLAAATVAAASPLTAFASTPASVAAPAVTTGSTAPGAINYSGYSTGDVIYANALNVPSVDVAKASIAQAAAAVGPAGSLTQTDQLKQPLVLSSTSGKTAYGHAAGVNIGLLQSQSAAPQVKLTNADATSPAPSSATSEAAHIPLSPLATADVLPGAASANTTDPSTCVAGKPISEGTAHVANATVLGTPVATVLTVGGTVSSDSTTSLVKAVDSAGTPVTTGSGTALLTQTTETIAPLTLFAGTPAAVTIKVLDPIRLAVESGGVAGTSVVSYAPVGVSGPDVPVVSITAGGTTQTLTSAQLFGTGGVHLGLGIADVTIGTPPTALTGSGSPTTSTDGTATSAAADFIRVSIPGSLAVPQTNPVGGPLGQLLNPVLNPVVSGLKPILTQLQSALKSAGLGVADIRIGHFEAAATAPSGGIICQSPINPLSESYKDVSALTAAPGQTFTYTVRFPNRGTEDVTNAKVVDTYSQPTGATPLSFVSSVPSPASASVSGQTLTYDVGTIAPGQFAEITLTFQVPTGAAPGTKYANSAVITGSYGGKPISEPVSVTGPTVETPSGACNIGNSTKFATNRQVTHGEDFGYVVNVFNSGGSPCNNVTVTDPLVSGVSFVSCTASCTNSGGTVSWKLGTLAAGQSEALTVIVNTTATTGTLSNTATITTSNGSSGQPSVTGPVVTSTSVGSAGNPASCPQGMLTCPVSSTAGGGGQTTAPVTQTAPTASKTLAFTGSSPLLPITAAGFLGLGGAGLYLIRRRQHQL